MLTKAAAKVFTDLNQKGEPFAPSQYVAALKLAHPPFAQTDE